jgi:hypothetical protein
MEAIRKKKFENGVYKAKVAPYNLVSLLIAERFKRTEFFKN